MFKKTIPKTDPLSIVFFNKKKLRNELFTTFTLDERKQFLDSIQEIKKMS